MFNIEGVCNHNPETTVWAHSNNSWDGKGGSLKAHDFFGAFACYDCHMAYDQGKYDRELKQQWFEDAFRKTIAYLWWSGTIGVVGKNSPKEKKYERPSKILPR